MSHELLHVVENLGTPRLLVVGDLILDRYTWGNAERISQEAPVILLRAGQREARLGGAANVAHMIRALGGQVALAGAVGDDADGRVLRGLLQEKGIDHTAVLTAQDRPTTVKERFIGQVDGRHSHQVLRVDHEVCDALPPGESDQLLRQLQGLLPNYDLVLVSDYGKGVCTAGLVEGVIAAARGRGIPVLVDPCRNADYSRYRFATAITPNRSEAQWATGQTIHAPEQALALARQLCRQWSLDAAIVTLDADGMALAAKDGTERLFPTRRRQVYDITGAGDMVLTVIGMCLAAGFGFDAAIGLGNVAGGLEVERVGVAVLTRDELLQDLLSQSPKPRGAESLPARKLLDQDELVRQVESRRQRGQRMVFTNGCFDLLHVGHVTYLQEASALGDYLVVAANSDASVRRLKGDERPIIGQADRAWMLAALECVDYVAVFDEDTPHALLHRLRPEILVKGGTYSVDQVVGREVVESYGGRVHVTGAVDGISTTQLLARLRANGAEPLMGPHFLRAGVKPPSDAEHRTEGKSLSEDADGRP